MSAYLTEDPLDLGSLVAAVADPGRGATVTFLGTVRASPEDGEVISISYSAYHAMAESEFSRIVSDVADRWPAARVALRHRLGEIPTGEASIAIAVAAAHRAEAFDACRFVIEETKQRVPVWKKERLGAGTARWVGAP